MSFATANEGEVNKSAQTGNGASEPPQVAAAKAIMRPRDGRQMRFAQSFAQVVAVLMRDPNFRKMRLADIEYVVLPAIMAGQFKLAQMPSPLGRGKDGKSGVLVPVAVALWARVSSTIDRQLSENLDKAVRLRPGDWASGDNIWLMAVAGDQRAVPKFIDQLAKLEFKGQPVKMRTRGPGNTVVVKTLGPSE